MLNTNEEIIKNTKHIKIYTKAIFWAISLGIVCSCSLLGFLSYIMYMFVVFV